MSNYRFSPSEIRCIELYLSGALMRDAAHAAGYQGASDQALCNTARRILKKFSKNPMALFRQAGPHKRKIAQLLVEMAGSSKSEFRQLKALKILARCYYP